MKIKDQLEKDIRKYSDQYYNQGGSDISDDEFDSLIDKLREIDPDNSILNEIGASSNKNKVTHKYPMLSLNKEKNFDALVKWMDGRELIATPKYDGNSLELIYENSWLVQAVTRGNGKEGEDITDAVMNFDSVPKRIEYDGSVIIRGEAYLKNSVFNEIKDRYGFTTSPRNATAGMISNEKDRDRCKHISFVAYEVLNEDFETKKDKLYWLDEQFFSIPPYDIISQDEDLEMAVCRYSLEYRDTLKLGCDIDGIVFMVNDQCDFDDLGFTRHHPRGAIAFKYESEKGTTRLLDIECVTGRTGKVSFTGIVEKILLAGANIERLTLHNADYIIDNNINIGDDIEITRSGEVIPKFERLVKKNTKGGYHFPTQCNSCGTKLIKESVDLMCLNENCDSRILSKFKHFVQTTDMLGVGESVLKKLLDAGLVKTVADLYRLDVNRVARLDRMGGRSARNVIAAINKTKTMKLETFLAALGISSLGRGNSERLVNYIRNKYSDFTPLATLGYIELMRTNSFEDIEGFADISATKIIEGIADNKALIIALAFHIKFENFEQFKFGGTINGESFVVTGTLSMSRKDIQAIIKKSGGKITSSVSKKVNYLVCGEKAGSKLAKAEKLGVKIINEDELMELINE